MPGAPRDEHLCTSSRAPFLCRALLERRLAVRARAFVCVCRVIAAMEIGLFLAPFSVVQYMPNFFYGSLLMVFGIEISLDWLLFSFQKVTHAEYSLLLLTFLAIMQGGRHCRQSD
jgi:hypothetical protein